MKNKIIKIGFATGIVALSLVSCSKDYLELDPNDAGLSLSENYYRNEAECFSGLVSVYDILKKNSGGFENMIAMMNAGSDDHYAGGGGATDGWESKVFLIIQ